MLSKVLIASTLMLFSANIMAAIWSWIDSVVDTSGPIYNNYAYTYRIDAWDDDDDTPNPCYGLNACTLLFRIVIMKVARRVTRLRIIMVRAELDIMPFY